MSLPIPVKTLDQHIILLGKTRSGKSSTLRLIVEELLEKKKPVCIIDPKGDWWGIKSSADGKKAGFDIVVFGGEHGDVPINEHSGAIVAELVATGNRPCLIDLGGWLVGERTRFWNAFASTLFKRIRHQLFLVIDECHNFAPQQKVEKNPQATMALHWANRIASEGLGNGINLLSASQRPQKVHKDYLTSHETLIAKQMVHKLDRDAIKDWVAACGEPEKGQEVLASVAGLKKPQAWVYSPEIEFGPKLVEFPMFSTYDSFDAKKRRVRHRLKGWASVDLGAITEKMSAAVEEFKANDPTELKATAAKLRADGAAKDRKIAQLEAAIASASAKPAGKAAPDKDALAAAEKKGFDQAERKLKKAMEREARAKIAEALGAIEGMIKPVLSAVQTTLASAMKEKVELEKPEFVAAPMAVPPVARPAPPPRLIKPERAKAPPVEGDVELTATQISILNGIAWAEALGTHDISRMMVAFLAGSSPKSSTFDKYVSQLKSGGFINAPRAGYLALTDIGRAIADAPTAPPDHDSIMALVARKTTGGQMAIVRAAVAAYPNMLSRDDLAVAAGMSPTSSTYEKYLSQMKSLGLVEQPEPKMVRASDQLFPRKAA